MRRWALGLSLLLLAGCVACPPGGVGPISGGATAPPDYYHMMLPPPARWAPPPYPGGPIFRTQ